MIQLRINHLVVVQWTIFLLVSRGFATQNFEVVRQQLGMWQKCLRYGLLKSLDLQDSKIKSHVGDFFSNFDFLNSVVVKMAKTTFDANSLIILKFRLNCLDLMHSKNSASERV